MSRRTPTLELAPILTAMVGHRNDSDTELADVELLDATVALLTARGLAGWTIDDLTGLVGVGRTTIYRRFGDRDGLVHAALARECHRFFEHINNESSHIDDLGDRVVEAFLLGLALARTSPLTKVIGADTDNFLPFLLKNSPMLIRIASDLLVELGRQQDPDLDLDAARLTAETLVRLALSFLIAPASAAFGSDGASMRTAVAAMVQPLLAGYPSLT